MPTPRTDAIALCGTELRPLAMQLVDLARELERELADATAKVNQLTLNLHFATEQERYSVEWRKEVQTQADTMRAALEDIHTTAHCLAKAGPLSTPTLDDSWGHFMRIGVLAIAALEKARSKRGQDRA